MASPTSAVRSAVPHQRIALRFPVVLLVGFCLFELALLAWAAFPEITMRGDQPLETWLFLAAAQALFVSWAWPTSRLGRPQIGQPVGQAVIEALLLAAAALAAGVPAAWWVDATWAQAAAGASYVAAWLAAATAVVAMTGRAGRRARWAWAVALAAANLGLMALAYVGVEFLGGSADALLRWCPMAEAAALAEGGWPTGRGDQIAAAAPVAVALVLLVIAIATPARSPEARG